MFFEFSILGQAPRYWATNVLIQLLENIAQGWWNFDALWYRKAKSHCFRRRLCFSRFKTDFGNAVISILTNNHAFHIFRID